MKYAFMSFSCPTLSLGEMLDVAQRYGYQGLEPRIDAGHAHGIELDTPPAQRRALAAQARDSGIDLCCVATSCRYADPTTTDHNVEVTLRAIDLAADVGAPLIRVFGGRLGDGVTRAQAIDIVAGALRAVSAHAEARGVAVCIETHDDWTDPSHVAAVIRQVGSPVVAVNWDMMHPVRVAGWTIDAAFEALQPWIRHAHVHDGVQVEGRSELRPMGEGDIDTRRAIGLLQSIAYDGFLSGEWINWEPYDVHLPRELRTMRGYESE
ncbi:MAG: sugar phosphate isomerase/epimerase [Anaerolineae bacterium]|nr:sugar phosphate isomerase/epimerase [Anaerolineae bacterium]